MFGAGPSLTPFTDASFAKAPEPGLRGGVLPVAPTGYVGMLSDYDQTSFLLAIDGQSNRQAVFSYNQADFSGLRWGEFKAYFKVMPYEQPFSNISMSTFVPVGVSPWVFDIYRDPKERLTRSNGDYEWAYGPILQMQTAHAARFVKYPKKDIGLTVGGDPR